jgi:hypothetical protein
VIERYRRLAKAYAGECREKLLLDGIGESIFLMHTEYCWPSLLILQKHIRLRITFLGPLEPIEIAPAKRGSIAKALYAWFEEQRGFLKWDPWRRQFSKLGEPLDLPPGVERELRGI